MWLCEETCIIWTTNLVHKCIWTQHHKESLPIRLMPIDHRRLRNLVHHHATTTMTWLYRLPSTKWRDRLRTMVLRYHCNCSVARPQISDQYSRLDPRTRCCRAIRTTRHSWHVGANQTWHTKKQMVLAAAICTVEIYMSSNNKNSLVTRGHCKVTSLLGKQGF